MRSTKLQLSFLALSAALLVLGSDGRAQVDQQQPANDPFNQAVCVFNSGAYPQAAQMFSQFLQMSPQDELAHYYLGVCLHCMGKPSEALNEYSWVNANSRNPELLKRAQVGLQVLSRVLPVSQTPSGTGSAPTRYNIPVQPAAAPTGWLTPAGIRKAIAANPGQTQPVAGQPVVLDLYTSWCGWCKVFEPIFLQAQAKYGQQVGFQRVNAELPNNKYMVKKYRVRGYPTVLFLDGAGKLIKRIDGAPQSLAEFEQTFFQAYPALKPF